MTRNGYYFTVVLKSEKSGIYKRRNVAQFKSYGARIRPCKKDIPWDLMEIDEEQEVKDVEMPDKEYEKEVGEVENPEPENKEEEVEDPEPENKEEEVKDPDPEPENEEEVEDPESEDMEMSDVQPKMKVAHKLFQSKRMKNLVHKLISMAKFNREMELVLDLVEMF